MNRKLIIFAVVLCVLSACIVDVAAEGDVEKIVTAVWNMANLPAAINNISEFFRNFGKVFFEWVGREAAKALNDIIAGLKPMILWNPDAHDVRGIAKGITQLLIPIYTMVILLTGMYLVFFSGDPRRRAQAKDIILKLIFSMVLVTVALEIFDLFLAISGALSSMMLAGTVIQPNMMLGVIATQFLGGMAAGGPAGVFFVLPLLYGMFVLTAMITIGARNFLVYLMAAIFPLTIFFYFFDFTKSIGAKLMQYTFMAIFTQAVQALILAVTVAAINSASHAPTAFASYLFVFMGIGGFFMIILAPLIMLGIMQWMGAALGMLGAVVAFVPGFQLVGGAMVAIGGVAAGMGPSALIAGGTMAGLGGAYSGALPKGGGQQQQRPAQRQPQRYTNYGLQQSGGFFNRMESEQGVTGRIPGSTPPSGSGGTASSATNNPKPKAGGDLEKYLAGKEPEHAEMMWKNVDDGIKDGQHTWRSKPDTRVESDSSVKFGAQDQQYYNAYKEAYEMKGFKLEEPEPYRAVSQAHKDMGFRDDDKTLVSKLKLSAPQGPDAPQEGGDGT